MKHHEVVRVHEAGLRILERTGVVYQDDEAVGLLRARGCRVEGNRVWLPPKVVEAAVEAAPQSFVLRGRTPGHDLVFGAGMVVAASVGAAFVVEGATVRAGTLADLQTGLRLMHGTHNVDVVGVMIEPRDLPEERRYRTALYHCLTMTDKPVLCTTARRRELQVDLDTAAILWGGDWHEELRLLTVVNSLSPLQFDAGTCAAIVSFARLRQPLCVTPCVMGGATGPATMAGILALQHAEALAGLTLSQAANEGAPFIYGGTSSITSMVTGDLLMGVSQYWTLMAATVEIARHLRVPCRAGGGITDSHVPDMQAGIETAMGLGEVARAGVHFVMHGTGVLSAFNAVSFEKFIIDDELVGMIRARNLPVEVDDDTLALDTIDAVGPGGNYLLEPHTLAHCRDYEHPTFFNRRRHDVWVSRGGTDLAGAARRHLQTVVDSWEAPVMDSIVRRQLAAYCLE